MRAASTDLPIRFDAVTVRSGAVIMLDRVSLQIEAGAPTVLIGPNGSGKTTFLRTAMGLIAPSTGRVTWGGAEAVPPLRRAFVFQRPAMLRRSAQGNLRYALFAAQVPRARHEARIGELFALVAVAAWQVHPQHARIIIAKQQGLPVRVVHRQKRSEMLAQRGEIGTGLCEDSPVIAPAAIEHPLCERRLIVELHQVRRYFGHVWLELPAIKADVPGLLVRKFLEQSGNRRTVQNRENRSALLAIQFFPNGIHPVAHLSSGLPGRFLYPVICRSSARRTQPPT